MKVKLIINPVVKNLFFSFILFIGLFAFLRLILLIFNYQVLGSAPIYETICSFFVGMRFDISISLYFLSLFFLINYIFYFFNKHNKLYIFNIIYLSIFFYLVLLLGFIEVEFFKYFKVRLNSFSLIALDNPGFALGMIWDMFPVVIYMYFIFLLFSIGFVIIYKNQIKYAKKNLIKESFLKKIVMFLVLSILIFIGIRGTVSIKTPLRWGHAYFSSYNSANQLALNGIFCFLSEVLSNEKAINLETHYQIEDRDKAYKITEQLTNDSIAKIIDFPLKEYQTNISNNNYNVVLILIESFSRYDLDLYEKKGTQLYFNKIKNQGIYFENFYSNGFHTYLGLFCSVFGMPGTCGKSIMLRNEGQQEFSGLSNIFQNFGYATYFGVCHDPNFDNMGGFLKGNGVDNIISQFDFSQSEVLSTLGVPDHRLYEKMNDLLKNETKPFFSIILTSNNHGPWIIPKVNGKNFTNTFEYTDWALEHFINLASKEKYFENTIFVITADHGGAKTPIYDLDLQSVHIPLLIYNPKLISPEKVNKIASHIDIPQIVLNLLGKKYQTSNFGRDVINMSNSLSGFAVIQEYNTLGLIWDDWYLIDRLNGKPSLYKYRSNNPSYDYSNDYPDTLIDLKNKIRSYYYCGSDLILNKSIKKKSNK